MSSYRESLLRAKGQLSALLFNTDIDSWTEGERQATLQTFLLLLKSVARAKEELQSHEAPGS